MIQHSRNWLCKLIVRNHLLVSSKPTSPIGLTSLPRIPSRLVSDLVPSSKPRILYAPTFKFHFLRLPHGSDPSARFNYGATLKKYSGRPGREFDKDKDKVVDEINLKFAEAREEIEMALESKETVYFDEEASCARAAVKEVVDMFEGLLERLPESDRGAVQRSMGLKIEQLKAELEQLND